MTVTFATGCYHKDASRVYGLNFLRRLIDQHKFKFNEVIVVNQDWLPGVEQQKFNITCTDIIDNLKTIKTSEFQDTIDFFKITFPNPKAEIFYDNGSSDPHWWIKHLYNILTVIRFSTSDYIVWQDSDITIERNSGEGWIKTAIDCLIKHNNVFIVSPGEGSLGNDLGLGSFTKVASQQIFIANRQKLLNMNWNTDFPYHRHNIPKSQYPDPFPQYWYMAEGLICRYMAQNNLKRLVLDSNRWRYWHHNPSTTMFTKVLE